MNWAAIGNNWVLVPRRVKGVVHFLGGAFLAAAPPISYNRLLVKLAQSGYLVVATPFLNNSFDHYQIARDVYTEFAAAQAQLGFDALPIFGIGHSMGCKIHLIINCQFQPDRSGNIFIAYNNYSAKQSIPFFRELGQSLPELAEAEFSPSPAALNSLVAERYAVKHNLLVKFWDDDIDEIPVLADILRYKFADTVKVETLPGNHLTSMGVEVNWKVGKNFSPLDAIAQWLKQETYRHSEMLEKVLLNWLSRIRLLARTVT
ncbi:MAG: DUF1350 family protein [Pseudanabaenaceae cyanobacterium SKYGB_i_bin29]|nr:DUF1350 family protein [Pseudanabaenaceae cyanobacterium SKYG29]MDW8420565.1 DUF1350 family protein [Pseudanabaenaceae cyanobacterium SKYGB_i_bin29]